jgi:hypothetical protein
MAEGVAQSRQILPPAAGVAEIIRTKKIANALK